MSRSEPGRRSARRDKKNVPSLPGEVRAALARIVSNRRSGLACLRPYNGDGIFSLFSCTVSSLRCNQIAWPESEIEEGYIVKTVTMLNRRSRRTAQGGDQPGLATGRVRVAPATGLALHARFESD